MEADTPVTHESLCDDAHALLWDIDQARKDLVKLIGNAAGVATGEAQAILAQATQGITGGFNHVAAFLGHSALATSMSDDGPEGEELEPDPSSAEAEEAQSTPLAASVH